MIKVIIIEDEKPAATYLKEMLAKLAPDVEIVTVIDNVAKATQWLALNNADLIFLDIHLGDGNSFSIFDRLKINTPVIFTTAYNEYAIKAFRLNSIYYLLKPFSENELREALDKFRSQKINSHINITSLLETMQAPVWQERFMVASGQKIKSIPVNEVAYFVSEGRYVKLVCKNGSGYLLDQSLESVSHRTDPKLFFRVNRQVLVGFDAIKQMVVWSKSRVRLELSPEPDFDVIVSIDNSGDFKKWLNR